MCVSRLRSYKKYGQFISMDATCNTNRCNMPLVLLVGVDDTMHTTIFGAGLLLQEDIESYTWLLNTFKRAVGACTQRTHYCSLLSVLRQYLSHACPMAVLLPSAVLRQFKSYVSLTTVQRVYLRCVCRLVGRHSVCGC